MSVIASTSSMLAQCPPYLVKNFDEMRAPLLPTGWVASQGVSVIGAPLWVTSRVTPDTAPNDAFSTAPDNILDNRLDTSVLPTGPFSFQVRFQSNYNLESGADGAVLEVSHPDINGGAFTDITDPAVGGSVFPPYNALITSASSPIAGRMAWTGNSGGYLQTVVNLGNAASPLGHCKVRFRLVTDNSGASAGWRIDTFSVPSFECPPPPSPSPSSPTPTATPIASPCGTPNVIADSTFEAGMPWSNWTVQTSTNFGTPVCNRAVCGTDGGSPYAGDNWAWFGGASVPETATLGQNVTFPAGGTATLSFVMKIRDLDFPPVTDVLNVRVDGTLVQSYPEGQIEYAYSLRTIDLSAFADGGSHLILFEYVAPTTETSTYLVDNVFLTFGPACPSPTPSPPSTPAPTPTPTATPSATATATPPPTPTPSPTTTPLPVPAQAMNISTRLRVETGERIMIGGFIVTGTAPKKVAIRGLGPSLSNFGLSDLLADPTLELRGSDGALLAQDDNWQDDPAQAAQLMVLGLALQNPNESGLVVTLPPGNYTALMAGKNQTSGIGLVEIYDADAAAASQLANISTRGFVQTGDNVMIGGFIFGNGSGSATVAVRGIGPSLSQSGLGNVLADPTLELRDSNGAVLVANDNWQDDPVSAAQLTAHGLAPSNSLESGLFAALSPGAFTAILAGKNGGVGIGLVEIYGGLTANRLTVTSTADSGPGSLRQALADAGAGDTIQFAPALNGQTIGVSSAELVIDKNVIISGPGPNQLTVERSTATGTPKFRIFHVLPGHVVLIAGLRISGGNLFETDAGGGVRNDQSALTLNNCAVVNSAVGNSFSGMQGIGGGVYNDNGTLEINDSSISGNFAVALCGGVYNTPGGTLRIRDSVVSGNGVRVQFMNPPQFVGRCGGIFNDGTAEVTNCTIDHNTGGQDGGGIENRGSLSIADSTIDHNTVIGVGGGIYSRGPLTIANSTISSNTANFKGLGNGGGIDSEGTSLSITNSTFSGNTVAGSFGRGSAIFIVGGTVQLQDTILNASGMGGSIHNESGTVTSHGYNLSSDDGGGFLTATGDQINTNPMLGPLQNNGGPTFTHALLTGSPAINTGDPNFISPPLYDQRGPGYPRVVGGRIDIGSFER